MTNSISTLLKTQTMSRFQMVSIWVCVVLNMLDGFDVLVMAFTASSVADEWGLQGAEVGLLLSAGLFGMAAGSVLIAPLADKYGRRLIVMTCLVIISIGMLLSSLSQSAEQLMLLRVFTGLGIGGMLASLNVIVSEYSNHKNQNMCVSLLQTGYPIGAIVGGIITAYLVHQFDWRAAFLFGAISSALMIPILLWQLPESLDFLVAKQPKGALSKVNSLLQKMGQQKIEQLPELMHKLDIPKPGIRGLFDGELKKLSLTVWACFFMVMFSFYFVLSWTPKLLVSAGLSAGGGISAGVLINLGGVAGGLMLGYISSRIALNKLISSFMVTTALAMALFSFLASGLSLALLLGCVIGFFLFGSMIGLYALVPNLYGASIRTTGMGWAIGVGRVGAILSPLLAGALIDLEWSSEGLFLVFAAPLLVSAVLVRSLRSNLT